MERNEGGFSQKTAQLHLKEQMEVALESDDGSSDVDVISKHGYCLRWVAQTGLVFPHQYRITEFATNAWQGTSFVTQKKCERECTPMCRFVPLRPHPHPVKVLINLPNDNYLLTRA